MKSTIFKIPCAEHRVEECPACLMIFLGTHKATEILPTMFGYHEAGGYSWMSHLVSRRRQVERAQSHMPCARTKSRIKGM